MRKTKFGFIACIASVLFITACGGTKEVDEHRELVKDSSFIMIPGDNKNFVVAVSHLLGPLQQDPITRNLSYEDIAYNNHTLQKALIEADTAESISWKNPNSTTSGRITIVKQYINKKRQLCKEYMHFIDIDGSQRELLGSACRQGENLWENYVTYVWHT